MRRWSTALIVGAILALAALAAADALRGDEESKGPAAPPTTARTKPPTLGEILRRDAVTGLVLYSDQDCRLHSLLLPRLVDEVVRTEDGAEAVRCRFGLAAGRIVDEDDVPSPGGGQLARCRGGRIAVSETESGAAVRSVRGCAPAWHPGGRLTYASGEQVVEDGRVLYSRAELHRLARRHPNVAGLGAGVPYRVRVLALAWLDRTRVAASLEVRIEGVEPQNFVVLLEGEHLLGLSALFFGPVRRLVVSPAGSFVADPFGTILTTEGRIYPLPEGLPQPQSLVFSPDERWLAVATGRSIYVVGTPTPDQLGRIVRLPVAARDLVWEQGGPVIDTSRAG